MSCSCLMCKRVWESVKEKMDFSDGEGVPNDGVGDLNEEEEST